MTLRMKFPNVRCNERGEEKRTVGPLQIEEPEEDYLKDMQRK